MSSVTLDRSLREKCTATLDSGRSDSRFRFLMSDSESARGAKKGPMSPLPAPLAGAGGGVGPQMRLKNPAGRQAGRLARREDARSRSLEPCCPTACCSTSSPARLGAPGILESTEKSLQEIRTPWEGPGGVGGCPRAPVQNSRFLTASRGRGPADAGGGGLRPRPHKLFPEQFKPWEGPGCTRKFSGTVRRGRGPAAVGVGAFGPRPT